MKALVVLPLVALVACNDHQKAPDDVPLGNKASAPAANAPSTAPAAAPTDAAAPAAAAPDGPYVSGTISVADALKDKTPKGATLFIMARIEGMTAGPPVLVKRVSDVTLPYAFKLEQGDLMMQAPTLPERLSLQARLDQDGDAMSKVPGDIVGATKQGFKLGATGIDVTLDQVL